MIDLKEFKYYVIKESIDKTQETHRTLTLAEAIKFFILLASNISPHFIGIISIYRKNASGEPHTLLASVLVGKDEKQVQISDFDYANLGFEYAYLKQELLKI